MDKNLVAKELVALAKQLMAAPVPLDDKIKKVTSDNAKKVMDMAKEATKDLMKAMSLFEKMADHTPLIPKNYAPTTRTIESLTDMLQGTLNELGSIENDMKQIIERNK